VAHVRVCCRSLESAHKADGWPYLRPPSGELCHLWVDWEPMCPSAVLARHADISITWASIPTRWRCPTVRPPRRRRARSVLWPGSAVHQRDLEVIAVGWHLGQE
jgi:hypothetical protein